MSTAFHPSSSSPASSPPATQWPGAPAGSVAATARPLVTSILGAHPPVAFTFWDGSGFGPDDIGTIHVTSPDAFRRILWSPNELGIGRAYVVGDLDVQGDLFRMLEVLRDAAPSRIHIGAEAARNAWRAARALGAVGAPLPPPPEEAIRHGLMHSKARDARAIGHHYDVGNDFYRLVLGEAMTYSCARYVHPGATLVEAQEAKHELICRKLGLHERPGSRLLDVGCGWGSLAMHAARRHHASVVGITISQEQAALARTRVAAAGLGDLVEIRLQDYRDLRGEQFDAISSVGMFEHVGSARIAPYFATLRALLDPYGRLLNHAISSVGGSKLGGRTFVGRYVFPDGELIDVGDVVLAMEQAGFEVRDVESLREHYARTLRDWVANLEDNWDEAVRLVGAARARIWRLYMAASTVGFEDGGVALHQVLGVVPSPEGGSQMPPTRRDWD